MTAPRYCPACLSGLTSASSTLLRSTTTRTTTIPSAITHQIRTATQSQNALKYRRKDIPASQKKKKSRSTFLQPDLKNAIQFSLVDAMRYIRASEVGRPPTSSKYELHLRLRTAKNGAVVRNRLRLPHPVKTDLRICVIAPPDSAQAKAAIASGAVLVGEESVFTAVKEGRVEFDRCLCHTDSLVALQKANLGRVLGPRGLMPSVKTNTVVRDVGSAVREMAGASEYRERFGVVRMAIGQLGMGAEELQRNIRAFVDSVKRDMAGLSDQTAKDLHEVVLSSTNGPGLSLDGRFASEDGLGSKELGVA
ncbi:hypothetical protein LTR62_008558 [Meristemomyces frigidus]|uniref:Ribosomal protein L1 n=1 Tax=Meristemomyces frigidus TaxID=1508187 RepID=A0AAN7TPM4_9PEZI|nr:hypothetical protein LTR62_008558 [Meristemomyces frigidus]